MGGSKSYFRINKTSQKGSTNSYSGSKEKYFIQKLFWGRVLCTWGYVGMKWRRKQHRSLFGNLDWNYMPVRLRTPNQCLTVFTVYLRKGSPTADQLHPDPTNGICPWEEETHLPSANHNVYELSVIKRNDSIYIILSRHTCIITVHILAPMNIMQHGQIDATMFLRVEVCPCCHTCTATDDCELFHNVIPWFEVAALLKNSSKTRCYACE